MSCKKPLDPEGAAEACPDVNGTSACKATPGLRICVAGLRGIPQVMGGVESHCEQLLPRLLELCPKHDIEVLGRRGYVPKGPSSYRGVQVRPVATLRTKYLEAISAMLSSILYARFARRTDILHIHAIGPALLSPLAKLLGLKVVVTHHGRDYLRARWNFFARGVLRLGEFFAVVCADRLIAVSPSLSVDLRRRFPTFAGKIRYIPNGATPMPEAESSADVLERFGLKRQSYVLAVGRLVPEKGFDDLIDAFERGRAAGRLVIAGAANYHDTYAKALLARASKNVLFVGYQDAASLRALYEGARLFVLPSYHEGLPITALEAAWSGAPIVLSNIQPNLDLGLEPANYFPVGDVLALGELLSQPAETFGVDREKLLMHFDWEQIAVATCRVYGEIAGANGAPTQQP
jgi:glycosyltransferase involved in cell wall biosynthesis